MVHKHKISFLKRKTHLNDKKILDKPDAERPPGNVSQTEGPDVDKKGRRPTKNM